MERINQHKNPLVGTNIKRLRLEKKLRNKDVVTKLQLLGVEISTGTYSKVELGLNNPSVDPVSYTHLDVYKRQGQYSIWKKYYLFKCRATFYK